MNFYWHFLNTSRFSMSWAEPYQDDPLGSVVEITQKGMVYSQDAVIVAKSIQFINDNTPIVSYSAVGVAVPTLEDGVAYSYNPSGNTSNTTPEEMDDKRETEELKQQVEDLEVNVWNFNLSANSYKINKRFTAESPQSITATATVQGFSVTPSWAVIDLKTGNTITSGSGNTFTFNVAWDNAYTNGLKVRMTGTGMNTIEKTLSVVDETEYDHDWGTFFPEFGENEYTLLPDHFTKDGVDCDVITGDFFVATGTWSVSGTPVVSPTGDPSAQGWYQRTGDGSASRPYGYYPTTHTSVHAGVTYYVPGQVFNAGWAYIYQGAGWTEMNITTEANAIKASRLLDDLVSSNKQIPSSNSQYSIWLWAKNFVAQNAVIDNLFSQAITILTGGYIKGGDRYDASGTIVDWSKVGFWFGANGKLMASLQSDGQGNTYVGTGVGEASATNPGQYNTGIGYNALFSVVSGGNYNIAIGYKSLYSLTSGDYNVSIGYQAMYSTTNGVDNIAIGWEALALNVSGLENTAVGSRALAKTTGNYNSAYGAYTLRNNTTGRFNVALGGHALYENTTGEFNVGIGSYIESYSPTGCYQMNFNDALIHMEFNAARQARDIYTALNSYFPSQMEVGATGIMNGVAVVAIAKTSSGIAIYGRIGTIATLTSVSTVTYTGRTMITFINPNVTDNTRDTKDCLTT